MEIGLITLAGPIIWGASGGWALARLRGAQHPSRTLTYWVALCVAIYCLFVLLALVPNTDYTQYGQIAAILFPVAAVVGDRLGTTQAHRTATAQAPTHPRQLHPENFS